MAKYTDPNTGVKYSTHTGLKVFTVIVVILLVISVVLNAVLYIITFPNNNTIYPAP